MIDQHVLDKIVESANITEDDIILEIGPGIGTLTQSLAKKAKKVIAVEIDNKLISILEDVLSNFNNIEIINNDILKVDLNELAKQNNIEKFKVVANLPYYITTPIIMGMLEKRQPIESIIVMIQKEVAQRMNASPSTKDYGSLSLMVKYYCDTYIVANVPRNCFMPRPNVDSAVIRLNVGNQPSVKTENEELLFKIIKAAFSQRRKTLLNCLFNNENFSFSKDEIIKILNDCGFDEKIRGEKLSLDDFAILTDYIDKKLYQ